MERITTGVELEDNGRSVASNLLYTPCGKIVDLHQVLIENSYPHIGTKPMPYRIDLCDTAIKVRLVGHHPAIWHIEIEQI